MLNDTNILVNELVEMFKKFHHPHNAQWSKVYFKNKFNFIGVKAPIWRDIVKVFTRKYAKLNLTEVEALVLQLFLLEEREYHHCAITIYSRYSKIWQKETIVFLEKLLLTKSWWDTVDALSSECLTNYFKNFQDDMLAITNRWNNSDNIWLQRTSILYQRTFKENTNTEALTKNILNVCPTKEFFIQKAIGWALREYAKTNADWVFQFVAENKIPAISKREALKNLTLTTK